MSENEIIPQDIIEAADDYACGEYDPAAPWKWKNADVWSEIYNSNIQGRTEERANTIAFVEWMNGSDVHKSAQRGFWIVDDKVKITTVQLHQYWLENVKTK